MIINIICFSVGANLSLLLYACLFAAKQSDSQETINKEVQIE